MKQFIKILLCLIVLFSESACLFLNDSIETNLDNETNSSPYLSITLTDEQFMNHYYIYDISTKDIEEVSKVKMTAQYAVGAIDRKNNVLYYSERDSTGADQLVKVDLSSNKKEKLTEDLFAINHIIPVDNKIFLSTSPKGYRSIPLAFYDLQSKKLAVLEDKDKDISVQTLTFNPFTGKLYASLYSHKERLLKSQKADKEQTTEVIPPVHRIIELNLMGKELKEIYKAEEMVTLFSLSQDEKYALIRTAPKVFDERTLYLYNLKTKKKDRLKVDDYGAIEHAFFSPDNNGFFFTARKSNNNKEGTPNALYYYNLNTGQIDEIFSKPGSYINNFIILN